MMNQTRQEENGWRWAGTGLGLVVALLVALITLPVAADVVDFPDPGLEAAIRDAIGITTGDIHDIDLIGLTELDARELDISNLEGIQHCVDLMVLRLDHNQLVDISPLIDLTNLTYLSVDISLRINVKALDGLANMQIWLLQYRTPREDTTYFFGPEVIVEAYRLHLYNMSGALVYEHERNSLKDVLYVDNSYRALLANEPYLLWLFQLSVKVNDYDTAIDALSGFLILR